ncbi:MAG: 30S ribosomal protein S2 [Patescibacteria group bacterium]
MTTNSIIEKLFSVGAHFGYAPRYRHPSTTPYLYGAKGGVELFDLEKTASLLDAALAFVRGLAAERKTILFVSGKAEARDALRRVALRLNQPYVAGRWIGGSLTNFNEIKKRLARLAEYQDMREQGSLAKFTKRERLLIDREMVDLEAMFGGLKGMTKAPDALMIIDPRAEKGALMEANQLNIPVISLLNTDCDASKVQYPIPGNDASAASVALVLDAVAHAYEESLGAPPAPAPAAN